MADEEREAGRMMLDNRRTSFKDGDFGLRDECHDDGEKDVASLDSRNRTAMPSGRWGVG